MIISTCKKKIREVTGTKTKNYQQGILVTDNNKQTIDQEEIEVIWTHYVQELFADNRLKLELRETGED